VAFSSRGESDDSHGPQGNAETTTSDRETVWLFPRGHGHMLECLGYKPCHFILIFDNGYFSEFGTFSIRTGSDIPRSAFGQEFGMPESAFDGSAEECTLPAGAVPPEKPAIRFRG